MKTSPTKDPEQIENQKKIIKEKYMATYSNKKTTSRNQKQIKSGMPSPYAAKP